MWAELIFVKAADFNYCCALVALVNVILYLTITILLIMIYSSMYLKSDQIYTYLSRFYAKPYHISNLTYLYPSYFSLIYLNASYLTQVVLNIRDHLYIM
jgi:hypothetical protein